MLQISQTWTHHVNSHCFGVVARLTSFIQVQSIQGNRWLPIWFQWRRGTQVFSHSFHHSFPIHNRLWTSSSSHFWIFQPTIRSLNSSKNQLLFNCWASWSEKIFWRKHQHHVSFGRDIGFIRFWYGRFYKKEIAGANREQDHGECKKLFLLYLPTYRNLSFRYVYFCNCFDCGPCSRPYKSDWKKPAHYNYCLLDVKKLPKDF